MSTNIQKAVSLRFKGKSYDEINHALGIPAKRFHITHQTSRASKGKRSTRSLPYGTPRLDVKGRPNFFRVKGWIDGLKKKSIVN